MRMWLLFKDNPKGKQVSLVCFTFTRSGCLERHMQSASLLLPDAATIAPRRYISV